MKINSNGIKLLETYKNHYSESRENNKARNFSETPRSDRLEISRQARDLAGYRRELDSMDMTRANLVKSLRERIQSGDFEASSERIATGIMQEKLLDEKV